MRNLLTCLCLIVVLGLATACGGGSTSTPPTPQVPGTLRVVALEGETAPEGGGVFEPFITATPMDVAVGGWSVFVAETSLLGEVVYAFTPNRELFRVLAEGDPAPDLASGDIDGIEEVWINENGVIVMLVQIVGGPAGAVGGLVTAEVDEGGVTNVIGAMYLGRTMNDTGIAGDLDDIDERYVHIRSNDTVFFVGSTDAGESALWQMAPDGSPLQKAVGTGDALPGGASVTAIYAANTDLTGTGFAFIAEQDDFSGTRGIYTGTIGSSIFGSVAIEGDALLDPDILETIPVHQPLTVYQGSGGVTVLYKGVSDSNRDHLIFGIPGEPDLLAAREGDADTQIIGGVFGALDWLNNTPGSVPLFQAQMSGAQGVTFAVYSMEQIGPVIYALVVYNGRTVPDSSSDTMTSTFPGLSATNNWDVAADSSAVFSNVLDPSGETGLYWVLRNTGFFKVARSGDGIPGGGDTYGEGTSWRQTVANRNVLFRAPVNGAGSGIFRQGP